MKDEAPTSSRAASALDRVLDDLAGVTPAAARPGVVRSPKGTTPEEAFGDRLNADRGCPMPEDVDALFGNKQAYLKIKTENFQHRLLLWYKLQSFNNRECAKLLGYSEAWISTITNQPWFQAAFVDLAREMGQNAIQTFLEGEVMPALHRTVDLARSGETHAVRLAANREILDRFLGKATVKIESKAAVDITNTVIDAARLLEEQRRLDEQIRANGLTQHGRS